MPSRITSAVSDSCRSRRSILNARERCKRSDTSRMHVATSIQDSPSSTRCAVICERTSSAHHSWRRPKRSSKRGSIWQFDHMITSRHSPWRNDSARALTDMFELGEQSTTASVTPSATLLISASRRAASPVDLSVLAIGASVVDAQRYRDAPPLANADNESNAIATLYPRHTVVSGVEATCDRVRSLIADFAVVHFAAHTARNDERVSQSALLLAPSPADHGELRLGEIASRRMAKTRLVVLAACSSAVADRRSDGAESLASAFIAAGVPTVVATLADVDDAATSRVMEAFHERFRASRAAASSARSAIRSEIRDSSGRIRIPLRWSSFTVVGGSSEFAINERVVPAVRAPRPPTAISDRSTSSRSTPWPLADAVRVSRGSMRD